MHSRRKTTQLQRYTEAARQKVLANNVISKVQKNIDGTKVSYLSDSRPLVRQSDGKK
jgi:hypothetical protein